MSYLRSLHEPISCESSYNSHNVLITAFEIKAVWVFLFIHLFFPPHGYLLITRSANQSIATNLVSQPSNEGTAFWTSLSFSPNRLMSSNKQVSDKSQIEAKIGTNQICTNLLIPRNWPHWAHPVRWGHTFDLIMQCQRHFLKLIHTHVHRSTYVWPDMTTDMELLRVTYNDTKHFPLSLGWACFTFDPARCHPRLDGLFRGAESGFRSCPGIRDNV